jgi:hypothetical protein
MKYQLLLTAILTAAAQPALSQDRLSSVVAGHSGAISDVTRDIKGWHDMQHPSCQMESVVSAATQEQDKDSSDEIWTVDGCGGKQFQYRVLILRGPSGRGFSTSVSNADGSGFHIEGAP